MRIFFGVAKISNIFWGGLKILIFSGVRVDAGPEPTYEEKLRVPPWGIPMGTNCALLVADLFLFCYERDFMMSLSGDK